MIDLKIIENGFYGLAVGDALGVPYEFSQREKLAASPCKGMAGGGAHGKPAGTWSDDTSMTLALADALPDMRGEDDYGVIMRNFLKWYENGEYTVDGTFDIGCTCLTAIDRYRSGVQPQKCGCAGEYDNGNGSLMRILPAVLWSVARFGKLNYGFINGIGALTHAHAISRAADAIYADVVAAVIAQKKKDEFLPVKNIYGRSEFARLTTAEFYKACESQIKSGGYVVDTLEAALWCFYGTGSYAECVLKAVNLGSDTDTVAAVAGSLAGLYYGKSNIPAEWLKALRGKDVIERVIKKFADFALAHK